LIKDGDETASDIRGRFAALELIQGRIFVSHEWGEARAGLTVSLANAEVSTPSNAAFWAEFVQQKMRVTCVSGWIEVRPSASIVSTRVRPGWIGEWPTDGETLRPADTDPRGQEDLQHGLQLDQRMRDLLNEKRDVLPR
jgi:hypothetical protein